MDNKPSHDEIYEKISSLFDIKFKSQLKDGPIVFENFLQIKNMMTGNANYALVFEDEEFVLKFKDKAEFISNFIAFIEIKQDELDEEFEALNNMDRNSMGIKYDENGIYIQHETIGHSSSKLKQLRDRLLKLKE